MSVSMFQVARNIASRSTQRHRQVLSPVKRRQKSGTTESNFSENGVVAEGAKTIPSPSTVSPVPIWQRLGPVSKGISAYGRAQRKRPYVTQFCSSLVIFFCGDISAQNIGGDAYDLRRTIRHVIIGGACSIPSYKWFMYLGQSFHYSSKALSLSVKVLVNQLVFTPSLNTFIFGGHSLLSGNSLIGTWEHLKKTVPVSFINSWKLWPAVTAFSFTYIPPQNRSLFAGCIAIGWQTYLSWLNQQALNEENARHEALSAPNAKPVLP